MQAVKFACLLYGLMSEEAKAYGNLWGSQTNNKVAIFRKAAQM